MSTQVAAMRIARDLNTTELGLDQALVNSADLLGTIVRARMETEAPFGTGQVALTRLVKALDALTDARGNVARVHADLRHIGEERADLLFPDECPKGQEDGSFVRIAG